MNNTEWNLKSIYESFDDIRFACDLSEAKERSESIYSYLKSRSGNSPKDIIEHYIDEMNSIGTITSRLMEYCLLRLSKDSKDSLAALNYDRINNITADSAKTKAAFAEFISACKDLDKIIGSSEKISEHRLFIEEAKSSCKHMLSEAEETLYAKMRNTGSLSWEKLWENITSGLTCAIDLDGDKKFLPLSETRNMAYSSAPQERKAAFESEIRSLETIAPQAAAALNSIKGEVINICGIRKYTSPLEMTLIDSRMDKDIFNSLMSAVKKCVPYFGDYFTAKARMLGHRGALPFYDLFAPVTNSDISFTYSEAQEFIVGNFGSFSTELGDFAAKAFENGWIDVYPAKGKVGGAFCSYIHAVGESRILTNFTGSFSDVVTIAHELGHAYHGEILKNESFLNCDYPMPLAETASTFCELLVKNAALKSSPKNESVMILENDLCDSAQIVVDIMSRFIFEDTVFKKRAEGTISPDDLCRIMLDAQKETYGQGLSAYHPYMWTVKPHYYDAQCNYYNFPYAFGLLLSRGLYSLYRKNGQSFVDQYKHFLRMTGRLPINEAAHCIGIDLTGNSFWDISVESIREDIDCFCSL